jgi:hypothetical protein
MKLVLGEMVHQAKEPEDKSTLGSGKVFVNLKGFDMPVAGAEVPNRFTGKRILLSFTWEHSQEAEVDALAREGMADLTRTLKASEPQLAGAK